MTRNIAPLFAFAVLFFRLSHAAETRLQVDLTDIVRDIRALHGINKGPIALGGTIDLTEAYRQLAIPSLRLHDCQWPYPDVVDIHAIFRNADADAARAESYDFALTDDYLAAVHKTGAKMIYRLGESIEHGAVKRFVHPPKDPEKWTEICRGIIRHYNEGWANGFRYDIRYWEIWNEPENRPAMWTGNDAQYFDLYRTAAGGLKKTFPQLKIGGPAVGFSGTIANGRFQPSQFVTNFLNMCRSENVPLDFFSWHCYTDDPAELVLRARAIRELLDSYGFQKTESYLNEWNYLPGNSWAPLSKDAPAEQRERFHQALTGPAGAAFIAASLMALQDVPVDVCNLFHGETGLFGLFNEQGVPYANFEGVRSFSMLAALGKRVKLTASLPKKMAALGAIDPATLESAMLIANASDQSIEVSATFRAPFPNGVAETWSPASKIDSHEFGASSAEVRFRVPAQSIRLVKVKRRNQNEFLEIGPVRTK
jgi:xylan 1,4-beta-xylosidase